jgi:hypothetical protein
MSLKDKPNADVVSEAIAQAIYEGLDDGKLPCDVAFAIAEAQEVKPRLVGQTADALQIRLCRCQLGLFGYPGKTGWDIPHLVADEPVMARPIPEGLEAAIREAAGVADVQADPSAQRVVEASAGRLSCAQVWDLAVRFNAPKILVGYVVDQLGIRIVACQLGAF